MHVLIITPAPPGSTKGNRITAERWAEFLERSGHKVDVAEEFVGGEFDCLIALHATRSHAAIVTFRKQFADRPILLCLTGTDLHLDLQRLRGEVAYKRASDSIELCDHIILLEPQGASRLSDASRSKSTVVLQSAQPVAPQPTPAADIFEISLVGHLREEKDPFLAGRAARLLPHDSKAFITHIGAALQPRLQRMAVAETASNPRYQWLDAVPHDQAQRCIARSRLTVLTSKVEGAPSAISEAIVNHIPILATKIPATIGLLGSDYEGLFPVGDEQALAMLMSRAECDEEFIARLRRSIARLAPMFTPEIEQKSLQAALVIAAQSSASRGV